MNRTLLLLISLGTAIAGQSQSFVEVSYGAGYAQQTFLNLETGEKTVIDNTAWDIAFTTDARGSSLLINEATSSDGVELELYQAPTTNFADTVNVEDLTTKLYNSEESWEKGAFNSIAPADDPFSLGWGNYNPQNHSINAAAVFVIKLRDESYKKLQIVSLIGGVYTFKHADLDGVNEVTLTVDKANFEGANAAYYSLANSAALELPTDWDLLFTRYYSVLDDMNGGFVDYLLTGTLTNAGVEVAQMDGVDPKTVDYTTAENRMETNLDVIGYDWKSFDLSTFSYSLPTDRVYFVKRENEKVYKLQFIDFEGSSTGNTVFEQTEVSETTTAVIEADSPIETLSVFPNPTNGPINIAYTTKQKGVIQFSLRNMLGQEIWQQQRTVPAGFQAFQMPKLNLVTGNYLLNIQVGNRVVTEQIFIND